MGQTVFEDNLKQIEFQSGTRVREEIPRGPIYRDLYLRLSGQLTIAAADNTNANTEDADEWELIPEIVLKRNQNDPLLTITAEELKAIQFLQYGHIPDLSPEIGDGNADPNFDSEIILSPAAVGMVKPADSWINSQRGDISSLHVEILWGDETDVNSNATGFQTDPTVDVDAYRSIGYQGPAFDQKSWIRSVKSDIPDTSDVQFEFRRDGSYRGFLIHTTVGGNDSTLDTVIDTVRLRTGGNTTIFKDLDALDLMNRRRRRNGIRDMDDYARSSNADQDAWGFLEIPSDGRLTETLDARTIDELILEFPGADGSSGTTDIAVVAELYELVANQVKDNSGQ